MTDSSSIDNDLVSLAPTAASILGIKGRLRFRLHGSSQKAHVVLRRVEPESDSEGEGETKGVAQFSLFAYKRIEVKPGKEILLTVADGPFKDRAIIFEGDELESSSLSDVEEETQIAEDDDASVPTEYSLPLKMRKPWAKRLEVPGTLAPASLPRTTRQSVGIQTDTVGNAPTLLAAPPTLDEDSQLVSPPSAPSVSKSVPSTPISVPVSFAPVSDIRVPNAAVPHAVQAMQPKMAAAPPRRHRDHNPFPMEIDSTADNSTPSGNLVPISPAPAKHDDVPADISADAHTNGKLERWSPSVPVPTILPANVGPVDGTSESESSSSDTEDRDPLVPAPERPWSPSVPAALSTQTSRRHNIRTRRAEQPDNANGTSHTQPGLSTEQLPQPSSPASAPPTPPSPSKTGLPTGPKSKVTNPFISGGLLTDFVGQPSSLPVSDEDHKIETLPEKISSSPPTVPRFARLDPLLPPPRPSVEVPPSSSSPAHPPSPRLRRERSPSRLSPASSRGSFSHGPLESSFTSVPSHPSSPNLSVRRSQGTSWPPFRPLASLGDGSTEFDPPFRAGPDFGELPQPPPFRPASGASTARGFTPPHAPTHGRPAVISSSNAIPIAPRHSFVLPSAPGRSSSPAAQSLRNSQPLGSPTIPPQPPRRPSHGMILDSGHPPRQPRSDAAMQTMASASLGQINPRSHNQYNRHQRHPHVSRPLADGRGRGISMAVGAKRKASPPRTEPFVLLEVPPKRPPPSTWPTALPIRCAAVQGERVAIRGIRFNRTGKLMAVTCTDFTIRVWDNMTYSEVARLPHSSSVVSAQWMDDDAGVLALCTDGALVRWTRPAGSTPPRAHDVWHWGRLVEPAVGVTPEDAPTALAYKGDRIAASFPKFGVRIWVMKQGSWQSQRPISRPNVTAIEFIDDGTALLGGTKDGVLWYCQLPDGVPRVYNFFKARICGIDVLPTGTHALVSQQVGRAHLVAISQDENRGKVKQVYTVQPDLQADAVYDANALFVGRNDAVLYGSANGYLFAWDKANANILCGLDHGEGCVVQAIGTYRSNGSMRDGCVVTGSRDGKLTWWGEPGESTVEELHGSKRVKMS